MLDFWDLLNTEGKLVLYYSFYAMLELEGKKIVINAIACMTFFFFFPRFEDLLCFPPASHGIPSLKSGLELRL